MLPAVFADFIPGFAQVDTGRIDQDIRRTEGLRSLGYNISSIAAYGNPVRLYGLGNGLNQNREVDSPSLFEIDPLVEMLASDGCRDTDLLPERAWPVIGHYAVLVPHSRAVGINGRTNWEGTGVQPDIQCDSADALDAALQATDARAEIN